jgi:hypothetical protein
LSSACVKPAVDLKFLIASWKAQGDAMAAAAAAQI